VASSSIPGNPPTSIPGRPLRTSHHNQIAPTTTGTSAISGHHGGAIGPGFSLSFRARLPLGL
jgi:hypothetical protein